MESVSCIVLLALGLLKAESETLGLQGGTATVPSGQTEVRDAVCAPRSLMLECVAWQRGRARDRLGHPHLPWARARAQAITEDGLVCLTPL